MFSAGRRPRKDMPSPSPKSRPSPSPPPVDAFQQLFARKTSQRRLGLDLGFIRLTSEALEPRRLLSGNTVYVSSLNNWVDVTHPSESGNSIQVGDHVKAKLDGAITYTDANWYVAGAYPAAYPSVAQALNPSLGGAYTVASRDTIEVGSGTYSPTTVGTSGVTLTDFPTATVKFNASGNGSTVLDITASNVAIQNISIVNQSAYTNVTGLDLETGAGGFAVNDVNITTGSGVGVSVSASGAIQDSSISAVTGIAVLNSSTVTIQTSDIGGGVTGIDIGGSHATATVTATNDAISGETGPALVVESGNSPTVKLQQNDLSSNATDPGTYVVNNGGLTTIDAAENYWGTISLSDVAGRVFGNVNFEPILTNGTDNNPGFTPDLTSLAVDISSGTASPVEGATYTLNLAPANPTSNNTTITQWVVNWGDGNTSTYTSATPIPNSPTHVYAEYRNYTIIATATDELGNTASTRLGVTVADAALTVTPLNIGAVAGTAFSLVPVATLTDAAGTYSNPSDLSATIDWGDGAPDHPDITSATLAEVGNTGVYQVEGSHTYASVGGYSVIAYVTDLGGQTADDGATPATATVTSDAWVYSNWHDVTNGGGTPAPGDTVTAPGETVPGTPGTLIYGSNAFSTIQSGINADAPGGNVYILPGTYVADQTDTGSPHDTQISGPAVGAAGSEMAELVIDKPVSLIGPNTTFAPTSPSSTPVNAQAVIVPATSDPNPYDPNAVIVVYVGASNVTIQGLTVDGINSSLGSHYQDDGSLSGYTGYVTANSPDAIDASEDIASYANVGNITIENDLVENAGMTGVDFNNGLDYSGGATGNNLISENLIQNISGDYYYGDAINLYDNFYAAVTNNVLANAFTGVQVGNFSQADPLGSPSPSISGNQISAGALGIWYNLSYDAATPFAVSGNNISAVSNSPTFPVWFGVFVATSGVNADFSDNTIDGSGTNAPQTVGYDVWNTPASTITDGTVSNVQYGVWANSYEGYSSPAGPTSITLSGVGITASVDGVYVEDSYNAGEFGSSPEVPVSATIEGGTTITTTGTGTAIVVSWRGSLVGLLRHFGGQLDHFRRQLHYFGKRRHGRWFDAGRD